MKRLLVVLIVSTSACSVKMEDVGNVIARQARQTLKTDVLKQASWALGQEPVTVTSSFSPRSAGNIHDFYSEGDYWWPNPKDSQGPYIQKDGLTNPDNFTDHRLAMIRFGSIIGALATAYKLTGNDKYVRHAVIHLKAWFINRATKMNPNLQYAQAIKGITTGRGIGIIDTVHLIEVAQGTLIMQASAEMDTGTFNQVQNWFAQYLEWLNTSKNGLDEKEAKNNHGTCWVMQVASFAKLCNNESIKEYCRQRYKTILLPNQMATDGSFPLELVRTKPYGYSIFNLDAMAVICQILSEENDNLWNYSTADGKSIKKGIEFLYPYMKNKNLWPFKRDVMYWENWPVAQPFLFFGAKAYNHQDWLKTWMVLDHQPREAEVIRNLPVRHPLIWL